MSTPSAPTAALGPSAEELNQAALTRRPVEPLTSTRPGMSVEDAYQIQQLNQARALAEGARIVGHKIGLTSRVMQEQMGVDQPDFGYLLDRMRLDGALSVASLVQPRLEAEIAFVMGEDIIQDAPTVHDVLAAVHKVAPAFEVIDSRIQDWRLTIADTVADNASSGAFVIGAAIPLGDLDLAGVRVHVFRDDTEVADGEGSAALGHPAAAAAWLARELRLRGPHRLRAGDVVLTGALHASLPVEPGQSWRAQFSGLGAVHLSVTD